MSALPHAPAKVERDAGLRLLSADEVAERLGVPKTWVYARARAGTIPTVKLGRYYRFRPQALEDWILEQESTGR